MHPDDPMKETWMYPHVVQFDTRRQQFARELQLIGERKQAGSGSQPSAPRTEPDLRGRPAAQRSEHHELEPTTERT
jgi:hypothetical protein